MHLDRKQDSEEDFDRHTSVFFFFFSGMCMLGFFLTTVFLKETKDIKKERLKDLYEAQEQS